MSCTLITTAICVGSLFNQLGTLNQSATVCRWTTSTSWRSSGAGAGNSRRVPCQGSVDKETYDRRIMRSKRSLPDCAGIEFLQRTSLSIHRSAYTVDRSEEYSSIP